MAFMQAGGQLAINIELHLCPPDTNALTLGDIGTVLNINGDSDQH